MIFPTTYSRFAVFACAFFACVQSYALEDLKIAEPQFTETITSPYEQYNDTHPSWSTNGEIISFERYDTSKHEIILTDRKGKKLQTIAIADQSELNLDDLFAETPNSISFNSGISWAPDSNKFVFTSNGKFNNFDLYIGKYGDPQNKRVTFHHQKDSHANWSPDGRYIAFVSSRNGWAQLYRFDTKTGEIINILKNEKNAFYPVWSPDSKKIAFMQEVNDSYQIFIINDIENAEKSLQQITDLQNTNLRPSWSSTGDYIAFFHLNNAITSHAIWEIVLKNVNIPAKITDANVNSHVIAHNVILNSESGPTWVSNKNIIAYVKNHNERYNPIQMVNINSKKHWLLNTHTMLNRDLSCSKDGVLAFQTQDRQWSRIFITKLPELEG